MARLTCEAGTVVRAEGELEATLRALGWTDAGAPEKRKPGRPRKTTSDDDTK